jgi:hypothetical protein
MTDHRIGPDLYTDVLDVLHRHGDTRGDDQHAGRILQGAGTAPAAHHGQAEPALPARQSSLAAGKEAGQ